MIFKVKKSSILNIQTHYCVRWAGSRSTRKVFEIHIRCILHDIWGTQCATHQAQFFFMIPPNNHVINFSILSLYQVLIGYNVHIPANGTVFAVCFPGLHRVATRHLLPRMSHTALTLFTNHACHLATTWPLPGHHQPTAWLACIPPGTATHHA